MPIGAFEAHAAQLNEAGATLPKIGTILFAAVDVDIQADTHSIVISGPNDVIDDLITKTWQP